MARPGRRHFVIAAFLAAAARSVLAAAPGKFRMVTQMPWAEGSHGAMQFDEAILPIKASLARLGYVEGQHIEFINQFGAHDPARIAGLLAEIEASPPHVLLVFTAADALEWHRRVPRVPILCWNVADPVAAGLAENFVHPGRNITGTSNGQRELPRKQVEFLRRVVPALSGIALVYKPWPKPSVDAERDLAFWQSAVTEAGLRQLTLPSWASAWESLKNLRKRGFQAAVYVTIPEPLSVDAVRQHAQAAIRHRIAVTSIYGPMVEWGFLMTYYEDDEASALRTAQQIDRILRKGSASDVPFMNPARYSLHLNLRTAKALGLTLPPEVRIMADKLVE
jgi:putative ABC transport system substrate-binding protein